MTTDKFAWNLENAPDIVDDEGTVIPKEVIQEALPEMSKLITDAIDKQILDKLKKVDKERLDKLKKVDKDD